MYNAHALSCLSLHSSTPFVVLIYTLCCTHLHPLLCSSTPFVLPVIVAVQKHIRSTCLYYAASCIHHHEKLQVWRLFVYFENIFSAKTLSSNMQIWSDRESFGLLLARCTSSLAAKLVEDGSPAPTSTEPGSVVHNTAAGLHDADDTLVS